MKMSKERGMGESSFVFLMEVSFSQRIPVDFAPCLIDKNWFIWSLLQKERSGNMSIWHFQSPSWEADLEKKGERNGVYKTGH